MFFSMFILNGGWIFFAIFLGAFIIVKLFDWITGYDKEK